MRTVNQTVETFAKPFRYGGRVAAMLNKVPVKTRGHSEMRPTSLSTKLRGIGSWSIKKYMTNRPLLSTIVQGFVFFLREFSIDSCGAPDDVVQFAKDYYLPVRLSEKTPELFSLLRSKW